MIFFNKSKKIKPLVLCILDGWGHAPAWGGNAITEALTPNFDKLWKDYPHTLLFASGKYVGLPGHEMGNSEVGHLNLGSGRVIRQDILRINKAIKNGSFFKNKIFLEAIEQAKKKNSKIHLMGLVSDGGIHSHIDHLFALFDFLKVQKIKNQVFVHVITDGRDSEPMGGLSFVSKLTKKLKEIGFGKIATLSGRYYAMDRDNRFERTKKYFDALTLGIGKKASNVLKTISSSYSMGITDEYIIPTIIDKNGIMADGDTIFFFNFRADRARQITTFLTDKKFSKYPRKKTLHDIYFVPMIPYFEKEMGSHLPVYSAFEPEEVKGTLAEIISEAGLRQLHIAETEKYAHVTYFFNGAREEPFPGEERVLVPSPKVATYDKHPEMSIELVCRQILKALKSEKFAFILINLANADMVGHTGNFKATVFACEAVDASLGKIVKAVFEKKGTLIVTADHGDAETMINIETGEPHTEHTANQVPFVVYNKIKGLKSNPEASLSWVTPTICDIMGLKIPKNMTGKSLLLGDGDKHTDNDVIEYKI